jgi:hypothetical protein
MNPARNFSNLKCKSWKEKNKNKNTSVKTQGIDKKIVHE